jgi:energy-coupling factor transporter ATP-binding protein EcfA2
MGARAERIDAIISKRRPLAARVQQVEKRLEELRTRMGELRTLCVTLADQVQPKTQETLAGIKTRLGDLENEADAQRVAVAKLRSRFERETLNIGVVGLAGQGKSRLLQSLSGLSSSEIPDGSRGHCTGVRSVIGHRQGEAVADVYFHTEASFLRDVVYPYYDELRLLPKPSCLKDFTDGTLSPLPKDAQDAQAKAKYEHLQRYRGQYGKYAALLRRDAPLHVEREHIREYVAQDDREGNRIFCNYMAVREVRISCPFPTPDVGRIALIDMPGLGDTGVGDQDRLIVALGAEVDLVLFVRMPTPKRAVWSDFDLSLYDTADKALRDDLPVRRWSFMVLNRTSTEGDNLKNCEFMREDLPRQHMEVVDCLIADCTDADETGRLVLDRLLDYLADRIVDLDADYTARRQEAILSLRSNVAALLEEAGRALGAGGTGKEDFGMFLQLFTELWEQITNELEDLLKELKVHRNDSDNDYQAAVAQVLGEAREDAGLPNEEMMQRKANELDGVNLAYLDFLTVTRARLSRRFLQIETSLQQWVLSHKRQLAKVFLTSGRLEHVGGLHARDEGLLKEMADYLRTEFPDLQRIGEAFAILADFRLSYRGLIQHRIRGDLDLLDPDSKTRLPLPLEPTPRQAAEVLNAAYVATLANVEHALLVLKKEPSQAAFSMVEEFVDQVLRAQGAKAEWSQFYNHLRGEVWPEQFGRIAGIITSRKRWDDAVRRVAEANEESSFRFVEVRR